MERVRIGRARRRVESSRAEPNESSIESDVESSQNASNIKLWAGRRAREKSISCGEREDHGEGERTGAGGEGMEHGGPIDAQTAVRVRHSSTEFSPVFQYVASTLKFLGVSSLSCTYVLVRT